MFWFCLEEKLHPIKFFFDVLAGSVHAVPYFQNKDNYLQAHKSIMSIKDKILQKQSCKLLQYQRKAQHDV